MKCSDAGRALIMQCEGCQLEAYHGAADRPGLYTIGYGHTGGVRPGQSITKEEAIRLFNKDLHVVEAALSTDLCDGRKRQLVNQHQFDALCSFVYNLGFSAYLNSTLRKKIHNGDYAGAAQEFPKWCYANHVKVNGLYRRRIAEQQMFLQSGQADIAALLLGAMLAGAAVLVAMLFMM